jgi:predicted transcriptional regulator
LGINSSLEPLIFRQDAINAWQEYQGTGLHLTGDEVIMWLDT